MISTPVQTDQTLWHTLRTRRRRSEPLRGIDLYANRWRSRLKHARHDPKYLRREAEAVVAQSPQWEGLTDAQLDEKILALREVFARRSMDDAQVRAGLAAVREVARRETGEHPFPVQIMGALGLFRGQIVEMVTGEGKTLTGSLAATMLGWLRRPVHVVTVNDYLAQRDADGRQPIYRRCGLRAVSITGETPPPERMANYRQPIIYLTQKELVADWLRDQLQLGRITDPVSLRWAMPSLSSPRSAQGHPGNSIMIPGLHAALVDEVDAVLIDEAVTPLIIAQPRGDDAQGPMYCRAHELAKPLQQGRHFTIEQRKRRCRLTEEGRYEVESKLSDNEHAIWRAARRREELVEQALVAQHCYHLGQHYQIVEDRVVIVDEYTGRFMEDRQWQHGLHQAVEAKHDLEVTADRDTLASLSFQRFFKLYPHLCGMTGTAASARPEMEMTYGLPVRIVPTNRPLIRQQLPDLIYRTRDLKWHAVLEEIRTMHQQGRPMLVATRSVADSELVSEMLEHAELEHQVLNAVHHKAEAQIVSQAGRRGAITVATNMAGRGTDIKLQDEVQKLGGLHVIVTEMHTAERIDRQLFGRAGRQGDPGSARCFLSLEDELILKYTPRLGGVLRRRFGKRSTPLPRWTKRVFRLAQRRAERMSYISRRSVLRHDEELDKALPRAH